MKIGVVIKRVPDTETVIKINADGLGWAVLSVGREIVTTKWRYASSAWEAYSLTLPK